MSPADDDDPFGFPDIGAVGGVCLPGKFCSGVGLLPQFIPDDVALWVIGVMASALEPLYYAVMGGLKGVVPAELPPHETYPGTGFRRFTTNPAEEYVCEKLHFDCGHYTNVAQKAGIDTLARYGALEDGDASDAYRHVLLSARLTTGWDAGIAVALGAAHEVIPDNSGCGLRMDIRNDAVGVAIGLFVRRFYVVDMEYQAERLAWWASESDITAKCP